MNWSHKGDRAVAITDDGDRLTVAIKHPRCWWGVRLRESTRGDPDREGYGDSIEDAQRTVEAVHRELRERNPGHAPHGKRLKPV